MALTREAVEQIANLARLDLTEEEIATYQTQLSAILDYAALLDELELDTVATTASPLDLQNVMREDNIKPSLELDDVLFNAPQQAHDQFVIQPVLDD